MPTGIRPDHRWLETAICGGWSDHPVTPSSEPDPADEGVVGLEP
jgi:hypothetical protein